MERSRSEYSILNIMTGFGGFFLNTIVGYICRMVFVRYLSAAYLGVNGLFSNIISMLSLAELGIGGAIGFALYKPLARQDHEKVRALMRYFQKAYQGIALVVTVFGLLLMPLLPVIINNQPTINENIYVIYLFFLFNTASSYLFSYRSTLLTASQRNYVVLGMNYLFTTLQSLIQIVVLVVTRNYILYLGIQTVTVLLNNLLVSKIALKVFPYLSEKSSVKLPRAEKKELFVNVKALTVNQLSTLLVNNTDNIAMTYFDGLVSVGIVSNYTLLVNTLTTLTSQLFSGLTAGVGNLTAKESNLKKYSFFKTLNLANFWIFSWGAIGIAFVSNDLVQLCFGAEYVLDPGIAILLAVNFYILGMQSSIYTYKNAMGLFKYSQYVLIFTAALNLILDVLLGRLFGVAGIILATIAARLLTNTWYEPYVVFRFGFKKSALLYLRTYLMYLIVLAASAIFSFGLCQMCSFPVVQNVIVKMIICSIVPNVVCFLCFHKTDQGIELMRIIRRVVQLVSGHGVFRR